jgi:hypothetical protein
MLILPGGFLACRESPAGTTILIPHNLQAVQQHGREASKRAQGCEVEIVRSFGPSVWAKPDGRQEFGDQGGFTPDMRA